MSQPRNEGLPRSVTHALEAITCSQRALAYLQVDAEFTLVGAGGNLGERAPLFGRSPATGQSAFFPAVHRDWRWAPCRSAFLSR